jgi:hypothetical protein
VIQTQFDDVPAVAYSLSRIARLRQQLTDDAMLEFIGYTPHGATFEDLVQQLAITADVPPEVMRESVRNLAGTLLTQKVVYDTAWRIAGNLQRLRGGIAVPPWTIQHEPEWVPVQILESERAGPDMHFVLRIMAGTPCPLKVHTRWSSQMCWMLARRAGYNARQGFPYSRPEELVNMRLLAVVDPARSRTSPVFAQYSFTEQLRRWNRMIIGYRFRREGSQEWPCPEGYTHACYECPIGYDRCPAGTHRHTFTAEHL